MAEELEGFSYVCDRDKVCCLDNQLNLLCGAYGGLSFPTVEDLKAFFKAVEAIRRALEEMGYV